MKNHLYSQSGQKIFTARSLRMLWLIGFVFISFFAEQVFAQNCTVNAGIDQTICYNSTMTLYGTFSGLPLGDGNLTWTQTSGPGVTITSPHSLTTTVTGFAPNTTYGFSLSAKCLDGSLISNPVTVTVNPITIANAGPNQTLCPSPVTGTLAANAVGSGETGTWSVINGSGINISDIHNPASTFTLNQNGSASVTLRWTIVGPAGTPQCVSYSDVVITNIGGVTPVNAGPDQTLNHCFSSTTSTTLAATYAGNAAAGQSGYWTVISGPNIPTIANPNSNGTGISNLVQGTYVLRWTVTGPCASGTDDMQIIVPAPTSNVTAADASASNQAFCDGRTSFVLTGNNPVYTGETVQWTQTSTNYPPYTVTISNPLSPITGVTISPAPTGDNPVFTFRYTISNSVTGCSSSSNATVSYAIAPTLSIPNPVINLPCNTSTASISYTQTGSGGVEWSIISGATNSYYTSFPTSWVSASSNPQSIPYLTVIGTYVVRFRKVPATGTGCSTVTADATVTTSFSPTGSNAGTDQLLACYVTSTALAGNDPTSTGVGQGTWTQYSGPNTAVISQIHAFNSPVSNLVPGAYIFEWLISGGNNCPTDEDTVMVRVASAQPTTANAGLPQTVCYNTPVIMAGNNTILNEIGTWTEISGATNAVFSSIHNPHAVVTNLSANSSYTFRWTITNGCGSSSADVVITVNGTAGPVQANAGPDQCQSSGTTSITLNGNDPSPGSGFWRMLTGPGTPTITDPTIYNTTVTGMSNGTYSFEWATTLNNCAVSRDTMSVTISAPVTVANAGGDRLICGDTLRLRGNVPTVGTGTWTQTSGNAGITIVTPNSNLSYVTGLIPGVYTFAWTISNGACPSSTDEVQFTVSFPPSTAYAGGNRTLCAKDTLNLAATAPAVGTGLWSMVSGPNTPGFSSYSDPHAHVTGLITGTYDFRWTVSNGPACTPSTSDVIFTIYSSAYAGPDQSLCGVSTANLIGNVASVGTWSLISGATSAVITPTVPQSNAAIASNLFVGTYTFQYTLSYPGCSTSSNMNVNISGQPSTPNAGVDKELCNASVFALSATPNPTPDGQTGLWTKLSGPSGGSFVDATNPATTFNGALPGVYIFVWTLSQGGCSQSDQVRITNYGVPTDPDAGPDQDVCGTWTTMAANTPAYGQGAWSEVSGATDAIFISTILPNTTVTNLHPGTYEFQWTIYNGNCTPKSNDVMVYVHAMPTTANAGDDQELCNATGTTLAGNQITTGSGLWTQLSGPGATIVTPSAYNSDVNFSSLPGATSSVYVFTWTSTQPWVINMPGACTTSSNVTITDDPPPLTAYAGPDQSICEYVPVVLAGNNPSPFTGTWTQVSGATNASFVNPHLYNTAVNGTEVGTYVFQWTIRSGVCNPSSDNVTVTINALPSTAVAGPNQILCNGITSTNMAAVVPDPLIGTGTWYQISGATNITYSDIHNPAMPVSGLTATNAYGFEWVVANGSCTSSDVMTLYKDADIVLTGPYDVTICSGGTPTLTVSASGGSGTYSYQWQSSTSGVGGTFSDITGATNQSYTTLPLTSGIYYQVIVECGNTTKCSATSGIAHVTVNSDPFITGQFTGSTICNGSSQHLWVTATGGAPELLYQWQSSISGCSGYNNISGATDAGYDTGPLTQTTYYRVRVSATGSSCGTVYSDCAIIHIPHITTQPAPTTNICDGGTATLSVAAGSDPVTETYSYQWEEDISGWTTISGATNSTYTTQTLTATSTHTYRCVITSSPTGCILNSNNAVVNVVADPTIPTIADQSICISGSASFIANPSGGVGSFFYQWESASSCSGPFTPITSANNAIYTTSPGNPGVYYYHVVVTQAASGCSSTSNCIHLTVVYNISFSQPYDQTICSGTSASLNVSASGGVDPLLYQWQSASSCGGSYSIISGATNSIYNSSFGVKNDVM
jgi:hypothetical protein